MSIDHNSIKQRHHISRNCFSLIELLIVVGIIAILAAILLPALQKAKSKALEISCSSRLKQIALPLQMYASDTGFYPTTYSKRYWHGTLIAENYLPGKTVDSGTYFLTGKSALIGCPVQRALHSANDLFNKTYGLAAKLGGNVGTPHYTREADVRKTSTFVTVADGHWYVSGTSAFYLAYVSTNTWMPPDPIHSKRSNYLFADGHVESGSIYLPEWRVMN